MDNKEFWRLIEASKEYDDQAEWITDILTKKELSEIIDFEYIFQGLMNVSFQSQLWGAAFVLMGGCSDDCFDYFRGWLIGQGEKVFNKVMDEPEYLAEYISDENLDEEGYPENEEMTSVGLDAYSLKKNGSLEWDDKIFDEFLEKLEKRGLRPADEIEFDWEEEDLETLYPLLWERFGEEPLG